MAEWLTLCQSIPRFQLETSMPGTPRHRSGTWRRRWCRAWWGRCRGAWCGPWGCRSLRAAGGAAGAAGTASRRRAPPARDGWGWARVANAVASTATATRTGTTSRNGCAEPRRDRSKLEPPGPGGRREYRPQGGPGQATRVWRRGRARTRALRAAGRCARCRRRRGWPARTPDTPGPGTSRSAVSDRARSTADGRALLLRRRRAGSPRPDRATARTAAADIPRSPCAARAGPRSTDTATRPGRRRAALRG